jgi:membrane protease YdiL (CAAX protease family)
MLRRGAAPWAAILASALSFSIVHLNLAQGIYALPLGILFGIIYCKTGNIVLTSMLHILNNGIVVLLLCVSGGDYADASYAEWFGGMAIPYVIMTLSFVLCGALMYVFLHCYKPRV